MIRPANGNKLTEPQRRMLQKIADNPGVFSPRAFDVVVYRNLLFANPALIEQRRVADEFSSVKRAQRVFITEAGAAAIGRADLFEVQDAPAQPGNAAIEVGDYVTIGDDVKLYNHRENAEELRRIGAIGKVEEIYPSEAQTLYGVQFYGYWQRFLPHELDPVDIASLSSEPEPAPELAFNEDLPLPNTADYWRGQYETACDVIYRMVSESGCQDANEVVETIQRQRRELVAANERMAEMEAERDDLIIERDTAIDDRRRFVTALEEIRTALIVARPVNDIFNDIRAIVDRALGEPVTE
jgi:hypothetical protein